MKATFSNLKHKFTVKAITRKSKVMLERSRGLDFTSIINSETVGFDPDIVHRSSPSGNKYLEQLLNDLGITNNDSIIDIGAGKGSAMRSMLKFPFKKVDGVELSEQISAIATNNFEILKVKRSRVYSCDATSFPYYDQYNLFYFYNPFPDSVMSQVLSNIYQSIQRNEDETLIIYNNPACHDLIVGKGVFSKINEYPDEWGNQIYVYSNKDREHSRLKQ